MQISHHHCVHKGSIASEKCIEILKEYYKDEQKVVSQSCEVALDMAEYETSKEQLEFSEALTKQQIERKVV